MASSRAVQWPSSCSEQLPAVHIYFFVACARTQGNRLIRSVVNFSVANVWARASNFSNSVLLALGRRSLDAQFVINQEGATPTIEQ